MKSFGELLSEYINQTGVSDAELARRLGVSRQTVFRWREGHTRRPRHRDDVLRMAHKLRLSPQERDGLLLSAGFPPEGQAAGLRTTDDPEAQGVAPALGIQIVDALNAVGPVGARGGLRTSLERLWTGRRRRWLPAAIAGAVLIAMAVGSTTNVWGDLAARLGLAPDALGVGSETLPTAAPGETLVVISPFVNYAGPQTGFNVADRLREALEAEFGEARLEGVRVEVHPSIVQHKAEAQNLGEQMAAQLVVWGEYDSGRVIAVVTAPTGDEPGESQERRWLIASPDDLGATINFDLPEEIRWMALYILGRAHVRAGRMAQAEVAFNRALAAPPEDTDTQAVIYIHLALLEIEKQDPDLNRVIAYYTEALNLQPELVLPYNNRGVAYLDRSSPGDLNRAEADLRAGLALSPNDPDLLFNLALILARQSPDSLEETLGLLERAEDLEPDSPGIQNGLCWFLTLGGRPRQALPHCDRAVQLDSSGYSHDSRALALALHGRTEEAISDFTRFLELLEAEDPQAYQRYSPSRLAWIAAMQQDEFPFDEATLQGLLSE